MLGFFTKEPKQNPSAQAVPKVVPELNPYLNHTHTGSWGKYEEPGNLGQRDININKDSGLSYGAAFLNLEQSNLIFKE